MHTCHIIYWTLLGKSLSRTRGSPSIHLSCTLSLENLGYTQRLLLLLTFSVLSHSSVDVSFVIAYQIVSMHCLIIYILFIHSFIRPFLWRPFKSSTTQRRSRLQHGYCIGVSRRNAQATAGKGLVQGLYVTARAGVEPTTLRLKVIVSTKAPPRPTTWDNVPRVGVLLS